MEIIPEPGRWAGIGGLDSLELFTGADWTRRDFNLSSCAVTEATSCYAVPSDMCTFWITFGTWVGVEGCDNGALIPGGSGVLIFKLGNRGECGGRSTVVCKPPVNTGGLVPFDPGIVLPPSDSEDSPSSSTRSNSCCTSEMLLYVYTSSEWLSSLGVSALEGAFLEDSSLKFNSMSGLLRSMSSPVFAPCPTAWE